MVNSGAKIMTMPSGQIMDYHTLRFAHDCQSAIILSRAGKLRSLSLVDGRTTTILELKCGTFRPEFCLLPDGSRVLTEASYWREEETNSVEAGMVWDLDERSCLFTMPWKENLTETFAVHPSGQWMVRSNLNGMDIWDLDRCQQVKTLKGQPSKTTCLAFSPDGRLLVSGDIKGRLHFWEVPTWKYLPLADNSRHSDQITSFAYDPSGQYLASCGRDKEVFLWLVSRGICLCRWAANKVVTACVMTAVNNQLVLICGDQEGKMLFLELVNPYSRETMPTTNVSSSESTGAPLNLFSRENPLILFLEEFILDCGYTIEAQQNRLLPELFKILSSMLDIALRPYLNETTGSQLQELITDEQTTQEQLNRFFHQTVPDFQMVVSETITKFVTQYRPILTGKDGEGESG